MDFESKYRPLYLLQVLKTRTDDEHTLTTSQLCQILKEEYGIETFRTTIKTEIQVLQKAGFSIKETRSTQNRYNYVEKEWSVPELKLLIDAVMSSKFITKEQSDKLADKLMNLAGPYKSDNLRRHLVVDGRIKTTGEQTFSIVDTINRAINLERKIRFQMTEFNVRKQRVLRHNGEEYVFSPYSLVWDGDCYYVVGYSDKHASIGSHRVDRIAEPPEILDELQVAAPEKWDINEYINTMFRMYDAKRCDVELIVANGLMDAMVDRFGPGVTTYACDQENFRVVVTVSLGSPFYNWIFGFGGAVKIKSPIEVKDEYKRRVEEVMKEL